MKSASEIPGDVAFRPLRISDFPLLQRWLSRPHVDEWWHQRLDLAGVYAKYLPRIDGTDPTHVFIIEHGSRPIGWIKWYRWADYAEHAAQLGAEPEAAFVDSVVFADPLISACVSDPETRNARSLRAFEKAGFASVRTVQLPAEATTRQVMRRDRPR